MIKWLFNYSVKEESLKNSNHLVINFFLINSSNLPVLQYRFKVSANLCRGTTSTKSLLQRNMWSKSFFPSTNMRSPTILKMYIFFIYRFILLWTIFSMVTFIHSFLLVQFQKAFQSNTFAFITLINLFLKFNNCNNVLIYRLIQPYYLHLLWTFKSFTFIRQLKSSCTCDHFV